MCQEELQASLASKQNLKKVICVSFYGLTDFKHSAAATSAFSTFPPVSPHPIGISLAIFLAFAVDWFVLWLVCCLRLIDTSNSQVLSPFVIERCFYLPIIWVIFVQDNNIILKSWEREVMQAQLPDKGRSSWLETRRRSSLGLR